MINSGTNFLNILYITALYMGAKKALVSLRISAVSPEPSVIGNKYQNHVIWRNSILLTSYSSVLLFKWLWGTELRPVECRCKFEWEFAEFEWERSVYSVLGTTSPLCERVTFISTYATEKWIKFPSNLEFWFHVITTNLIMRYKVSTGWVQMHFW